MQISEIFESIQGEGPWIGYPTTFVRLYGCNLNCSFCDSEYSRNGTFRDMRPLEVADEVLSHAPTFIVFTGGEPTMQYAEMKQVVDAIRKYDPSKQIAIETNGTNDFDDTIFDVVVVSPKSMAVVELWSHRPNVYVKFLASDENDISNIRRRIGMHVFANMPYVMPIGVTSEGIIGTSKVLSELIVSSGMDVVFSPRLHILMGVK